MTEDVNQADTREVLSSNLSNAIIEATTKIFSITDYHKLYSITNKLGEARLQLGRVTRKIVDTPYTDSEEEDGINREYLYLTAIRRRIPIEVFAILDIVLQIDVEATPLSTEMCDYTIRTLEYMALIQRANVPTD